MASGIKQMARDAIGQYNADVAAGGEPLYPEWADEVLAVIDSLNDMVCAIEAGLTIHQSATDRYAVLKARTALIRAEKGRGECILIGLPLQTT